MIKKTFLWVLVILWMSVIFSLSAQPATQSNAVSRGFTKKIISVCDFLDVLSDAETENIAMNINKIVRKCAHFSAYAFLAFLITALVRSYHFRWIHSVVLAVVLSGLFACTDEYHQLFVPGRSGEIRDVGIDTLGALFGSILMYLLWNVKKVILKKF